MQILQRFFKVEHESPRETTTKKEGGSDQKAKSKDGVSVNRRGAYRSRLKRVEESRFNCKNLNPFTVLSIRDIAKACFFSTIHLRRLGSFQRKQHWNIHSMKMKKEDSAAHGGNKVLPISDAALSYSRNVNGQCGAAEKREKAKGDKTKTFSKMKELLRWAAAAKTEKGGKYISRKVLQFRNRATLKAVQDDDQLSNESPKISFRWDVESCSTSSSVYSAISMASSTRNDHNMNMASLNSTPFHDRSDHCTSARPGNWITTDSEFVVLEL